MIDSSRVLCYAAKWVGNDQIFFDSIKNSSHKSMLKGIHALLDMADGVISYNGRKFDLPVLHKEFLLHNFNPPSPYKHIDLLNTMRRQFKFTSNKLDYVCQQLKLGKKSDHEGFELWLKCMNKDAEAWKKMEEYNVQDVILLEKLYHKLMPWIQSHPNQNVFADEHVCPSCASPKIQKRGTAVSGTGVYQRYQCRACGTWSQSTKALSKTTEIKRIPT
jgi:uncharacterized protein YprB with RNaseH-like and TPR domain